MHTKISNDALPAAIKCILEVIFLPLSNETKGNVVHQMYRKIQLNVAHSKNLKGRKIWVIMKLALEKNREEYPPITRESNGHWGFNKDQKAFKYKKKDFMNCAKMYNYLAEELLVCCIYT
tara:strand:+ start:161 stop:520 length:360 start_codon:yes stop_codon:yes gene_type:complete